MLQSAWLPLLEPTTAGLTASDADYASDSSLTSAQCGLTAWRSTFTPIPFLQRLPSWDHSRTGDSLPSPDLQQGVCANALQHALQEVLRKQIEEAQPSPTLSIAGLFEEDKRVGQASPVSSIPSTCAGESLVIREMTSADSITVRELHNAYLPLSLPGYFYTHLLTSSDMVCLIALAPKSLSMSIDSVSHKFNAMSVGESATPGLPGIPQGMQVIGCASARIQPGAKRSGAGAYGSAIRSPSLHLLTLVVAPSFRRQGVATKLCRALLRHTADTAAKAIALRTGMDGDTNWMLLPPIRADVTLHVAKDNTAAIEFYQRKWGLKIKKVIRGYYNQGVGDGVEMTGLVNCDN